VIDEGRNLLTDEERVEIEAEISYCPERRSGCVEALRVVQRHHRWVSDEHVAEVADLLGMTIDELDAVATFYPFIFRKPVGRHVILVCDSITCWVMGYESLADTFKKELGISWGETTADGRFTLLPTSCLGECDHAPAIVVDDEVHRGVAPEQIGSILSTYA
jgi:NADH-quinone oxidoreductase subunit E